MAERETVGDGLEDREGVVVKEIEGEVEAEGLEDGV